jgi:hypothetical protein
LTDRVRGLASPPAAYLPAATQVTEQLMSEFPELESRYGARGREFGIHDTAYQIAWIVSAVELDSPEVLRRNILWLRDLLAARDFPLEPFRRNLELALEACRAHGLVPDENLRRVADPILDELGQ